jgi:DNA-binding transcriptional ArsR family regulator
MRESVRSGRRENFYVTDNSFIDHYARAMQPTDIAVYHALERYANCHTRSTWVGTAKIAEVLNVSQRTVQRSLKVLEDLKLIRIVQTSTVKMYFIVPVPARAKIAAIPLFDGIDEKEFLSPEGDIDDVWATSVSASSPSVSRVPSLASRPASSVSQSSDTDDGLYKEEQDLPNKTIEQDSFNKTGNNRFEVLEAARRVIRILGLNDKHIDAAVAAVELEVRETQLSADQVVEEIWKKATRANHKHLSRDKFIEDYLAQRLAERILDRTNLPPTNNLIVIVTAALKAEVRDTGLGLEETATQITTAAAEDRRRGMAIDRFYFENCKWRLNGGVSKAERRKLDNLEVNARVKQRLREKLGAS